MRGSQKERWITLANGNRCRLDENGVVTAGPKMFQGKHISQCGGPLTDTTPDMDAYARAVAANGGDHYAGARQFFQEKLQGHSVKCHTADGEREAELTGGTWQEIKRDMKTTRSRPGLCRICRTSSPPGHTARMGSTRNAATAQSPSTNTARPCGHPRARARQLWM